MNSRLHRKSPFYIGHRIWLNWSGTYRFGHEQSPFGHEQDLFAHPMQLSQTALKQPVLKQGQASSAPLHVGGQLTASHFWLSGTAQLLQNFIFAIFGFFLIFDENCRKKLDYKEDGHVRIDDFYDCRK